MGETLSPKEDPFSNLETKSESKRPRENVPDGSGISLFSHIFLLKPAIIPLK